MSYTIKYAPKLMQDYVFPSKLVEKTVERYIKGNDLRPIILHGTNGVGKSSLAKLLPSAMEGEPATFDVVKGFEVGEIGEVKGLFKGPPMFYKMFSEAGQKRRYIIINEAHMTYKASLAMRDIIDEMQEEVQFIFTTNMLEQIDVGVRDRSCCVHVGAANANAWLPRAKHILLQEGIELEEHKLMQMLTAQLEVSSSNRRLLEYLQAFVETVRSKSGGTPDASHGPVAPSPSPHYNPLGLELLAA